MRDRVHGSAGRFDPVPALVLTGVLTLLWTALSGASDYAFGLAAIAATVVLSQSIAPVPAMNVSLRGLPAFACFFVHGSLAGGADVARRALSPRLPLEVHRHWHPLALPPGPPRAVLVGVISLLPGTLSVRLHGEHLLVHSIAGDARERIRALEARVAGLFGQRRAGDDEGAR